jgi:hypothetical protein
LPPFVGVGTRIHNTRTGAVPVTHDPSPDTHPAEERCIQEVARRPGGWALRVGGSCTPVFLPDDDVDGVPAAGDRLRTFENGTRVVVRT